METVCNKLENNLMEVKIEFSKEEWKGAQKKALNKLAKRVNLDGFRKGKAPAQLVKARIGNEPIFEDALDLILQSNSRSILTENGFTAVGQPEVSIDSMNENELKITVTVPVKPDVTLGEYKGLEIEKTTVSVSEEEVNNRLADYQKQYAELVIKEDGTVEDGDSVVIDYEGFKDGVAFDGGKDENHTLVIGSGSFIPGFEEQLIGMKADEEKEINVTFPEEYHDDALAGQDAMFKVKVHEIKYKELPEIDDELAKDVNIEGVETLEQLKAHVEEDIRDQKQVEADNEFNEKISEALIENTPIDIPAVMIDSEVDYMLNQMNQNLSAQGATLDLYLQIMNKTEDQLKDDLREQATKNVHLNLVLEKIAEVENIEVTDEELDEELNDVASYYKKDLAEIKKVFASQLDGIKQDIACRKAVDLVKESVK